MSEVLGEELIELVLNDHLRDDKPQTMEGSIEEEYILMVSCDPNKVLTTDYVKETVRLLAQREGDPRDIVVTIKNISEENVESEEPAEFDSEGPHRNPLKNVPSEELLKEMKKKEQEKAAESKTRPVAYVAPSSLTTKSNVA